MDQYQDFDEFNAGPAAKAPTFPWKWILAGVCLATPLIGLGYWLGIGPMIAARDEKLAVLAEKRAKNQKAKDDHANYERFLEEAAEVERLYEARTAQISEMPDREVFGDELQALAGSIGGDATMRLTGYDPQNPEPVQKDAPGLASLSELPIHLEFRGNWPGLRRLIVKLNESERLTKVTAYQGTIRERADGEKATANFTVETKTFFKRYSPKTPQTPSPAADSKAPKGA